jgi:peptidoglycan/xylan/chitin deacetylase (PgdA/CDA1 family)
MLKRFLYRTCKWTGIFHLARLATRRGLRILAYHGFADGDEIEFLPLVFMDLAVFRKRMQYLVRQGYPVLPLDEAVERLRNGTLPAAATVITFDDGFDSIRKMAVPVLKVLGLPGTIYVTTYYCLKSNPIFRLVIQYMFWKTSRTELDLSDLGTGETGKAHFPDTASANEVAWNIIQSGEDQMDERQRVRLSEELGRRLGVDYAEIVRRRFLALMTEDEIRQTNQAGIDIQLHTHRHVLPLEAEMVRREIEDNRRFLEPLTRHQLRHFCYPSGIHREEHLRPLAEAGVVSGTTCDSGLNYADTPVLTLHRFLDDNNVSWIEFEAEMSGFSDLLRRARSRWLQLVRRDSVGSEALQAANPYAAPEGARPHGPRG